MGYHDVLVHRWSCDRILVGCDWFLLFANVNMSRIITAIIIITIN
jgi:hypothetical protein